MEAMSDSTGVKVDVAKGHIDVAIDAVDEVMRYGNDVEGHTAFGSAMRSPGSADRYGSYRRLRG
jgi:hypothetical protein